MSRYNIYYLLMLDIKNKKFGRLTAIEFLHFNSRHRGVWKCICKCGKETTAEASTLQSGMKTNCGCERKKVGHNHRRWRGYGELSLTRFTAIQVGAIKRKIEFDLTIEYLWELFLKQNRTCAISGEPLMFDTKKKLCDATASLDRIDSMGGYVVGNVQWVHKDVNYMKTYLSMKDFYRWIDKIHNYKSDHL